MSQAKNNAHRICQTVCRIPAGRVAGYGFVADLAGLPGCARLVGRVLQAAPVDMRVPWHRVLRSNGQIAFVKGSAQAKRQRDLLREEGVVVMNNRVNMHNCAWQPELGELMEMDF